MSKNSFPVSGLKKYSSDAPKSGTVEVSVDWQKLVRVLGTKAAFNKSHKTRALNGVVIVKFKEAA